ncbi:hypothetical protein BHE74_00053159 [Ensete ventricosum]|nr:hypothetical protein BHE74_00053159 [Ensete ventricosum]
MHIHLRQDRKLLSSSSAWKRLHKREEEKRRKIPRVLLFTGSPAIHRLQAKNHLRVILSPHARRPARFIARGRFLLPAGETKRLPTWGEGSRRQSIKVMLGLV